MATGQSNGQVGMKQNDNLEQRARQGEHRAQLHLGLALWTGAQGREPDLVTAYAWLRCAQEAKVPYVGAAIEAIYEEMTDEETVEALARAQEFNRDFCPNCP